MSLALLPALTLVGAHHPEGAPLLQRGLVVRLEMAPRVRDGLQLRIRGSAFVQAEGIVEGATATVVIELRRRRIDYCVRFADESGAPWTLRLTQGGARLNWRALTELAGHLSTTGREAPPSIVRLRLGWRVR